jgi:hypothetical protein
VVANIGKCGTYILTLPGTERRKLRERGKGGNDLGVLAEWRQREKGAQFQRRHTVCSSTAVFAS